MRVLSRFLLWIAFGTGSLLADVVTKAAPHRVVVENPGHAPVVILVLVAAFLCGLALWHSTRLLAIGTGLMFGGLCGNAGQALIEGHASDWLPVGGLFTNVADISGALGLLCCFAGYILERRQRLRPAEEVSTS
jgi:lipoprotein signal peptidase